MLSRRKECLLGHWQTPRTIKIRQLSVQQGSHFAVVSIQKVGGKAPFPLIISFASIRTQGQPVELDKGFSVEEIWERSDRRRTQSPYGTTVGENKNNGEATDDEEEEDGKEEEEDEYSKFLDLSWTFPRGMSLMERFTVSFKNEHNEIVKVR